MRKVMRPGTIDTGNGRRASVYIRAKDTDSYLSITGVIGPLPSGNALGGCGQIDMEFGHRDPRDDDERYLGSLIKPEAIRFSAGWTAEKWMDLLDIWHGWHLKPVNKVPQEIIAEIEKLPDADRQPAWV
jgi:hypothetical protein